MRDESGSEIAQYRLISKLGEGGMGAVYLAEHVIMGKRLAVKVMRAEVVSPELVARFINEARAAASIAHPGIVTVFDCGLDAGGRAYMAMELLRGESLGAFLRRCGPLAAHAALARRIVHDTALAVSAAHAAGVVHRDLKPDNLFLTLRHDDAAAVEVKVLDFGIAKLAAAISGPAAQATQSGALMGTAVYMSPEQCLGAKNVDGRSDVYALGCILFEMLAGRPVFADLGVGPTIAAHLSQPPPRLRDLVPGVDAALDALVARMLEKDPGARPASMAELARELGAGLPDGARGPISLPPKLALPGGASGQPRPVARTLGVDEASLPTLPGDAGTPAGGAVAAASPKTTLSASVAEISGPSPPKRPGAGARASVVAVAVAGLVAAVLALRARGGDADGAHPPPPVETISLEVTGLPPGGRALLDGAVVSLPARVPRDARAHELRVEAPGFGAYVDHIRAERDLRVAVTLAPLPPPQTAATPAVAPPATTTGKRRPPREANTKETKVKETSLHEETAGEGEGQRRARTLIKDID